MWYCEYCKKFFDEPAMYTEGHRGMDSDHFYQEAQCPTCGETWIEEVHECRVCGDPCMPHNEFCDDCHDSLGFYLRTIKEKFKITEEDLQDMIVEHYGW